MNFEIFTLDEKTCLKFGLWDSKTRTCVVDAKIGRYELGAFIRYEVALKGRPAVTVGDEWERPVLTKEVEKELVIRAIKHWKSYDLEEEKAGILRRKYPNAAIIVGFLPQPDIEWEKEGYYAYALKPRRKSGKSQVQEAIEIKSLEEMK